MNLPLRSLIALAIVYWPRIIDDNITKRSFGQTQGHVTFSKRTMLLVPRSETIRIVTSHDWSKDHFIIPTSQCLLYYTFFLIIRGRFPNSHPRLKLRVVQESANKLYILVPSSPTTMIGSCPIRRTTLTKPNLNGVRCRSNNRASFSDWEFKGGMSRLSQRLGGVIRPRRAPAAGSPHRPCGPRARAGAPARGGWTPAHAQPR